MISSRLTAAVLALSALGAVHAQPVQTGLTRDHVRAELLDAQRQGDVPVAGELGLKPREITPQRYPASKAEAGRTRAQVVAELLDARREGDVEIGESGRTA